MFDLDIYSYLNKQQLQCISNDSKRNLIIAGAGTGKTTVLVTKIHYYLTQLHIPSNCIIGITFTNKAAHELKERLSVLEEFDISRMFLGTFHSIALKLMYLHSKELGIGNNFSIYDDTAQKNLVKSLVEQGLLENILLKSEINDFLHIINNLQEHGISTAQLDDLVADTIYNGVKITAYMCSAAFHKAFRIYKETMVRNKCYHFSDLVLFIVTSLRQNKILAERIRGRFKAILIDEVQDLNEVQFEFIKELLSEDGYLFAVGDDDQSIYKFRGADPRNMRRFIDEIDGVATFKIEQNYRSVQNILDMANVLISYSKSRLEEKHLQSNLGVGNRVCLIRSYSNTQTQPLLVKQIVERLIADGDEYADMAIIYRNNSLSRPIEMMLKREGMPYRIARGREFLKREEIKVVISYLSFLHNIDNYIDFETTCSIPKKRLGASALAQLQVEAQKYDLTPYAYLEFLQELIAQAQPLSAVQKKLIKKFSAHYASLQGFIAYRNCESVAEIMQYVLQEMGVYNHYEVVDHKENNPDGNRTLNLKQFYLQAQEFDEMYSNLSEEEKELEGSVLSAFVASCVLGDENDDEDNVISLMTMHAAKGLEFKNVIIIDFDSGIIPSYRSINSYEDNTDSEEALDEERRLAYVAITRAKQRLFVIYNSMRSKEWDKNNIVEAGPSSFLVDICSYYKDHREIAAPFKVIKQ